MALGVADGGVDIARRNDRSKLLDLLLGAALVVASGPGVEGATFSEARAGHLHQIDVGRHAVQQPHQLPRLLGTVVDILEHDVSVVVREG